MRNLLHTLAAAALCGLALSSPTLAQALDQNATAPKSATQAPAPPQQATSDSPEQPMSIAEMARAARAKKQAEAQPVPRTSKLLDDDNMPRGTYAADAAPAKPPLPALRVQVPQPGALPFPSFAAKSFSWTSGPPGADLAVTPYLISSVFKPSTEAAISSS
jgi:hypothetical protein